MVFIKSKNSYLLTIYILVFFISDILNFVFNKGEIIDIYNSVSFYPKGFLLIYSFVSLLSDYKRNKLLLSLLLLFVTITSLGYLDFQIRFSSLMEVNVIYHFKQIIKYVAPVIVYQHFSKIEKDLNLEISLKVIKVLYLLCAGLVIVALICSCDYFMTYGHTRFGYKPPIEPHNDITLFWMIGIAIFYSEYSEQRCYKKMTMLIVLVFASILLGTKAILLFITLLLFYLMIFESRKYQRKYILSIVFLAVILIGFFIYYSGMFSFFDQINDEKGIWYSLSSMRTYLIELRAEFSISKWEWYNYFIGGATKQFPLVEMNVIDLFWFSGVTGFVIYFTLIFKYLFSFSRQNRFAYFFVYSFILIGALAGHVYSSGINVAYLVFLTIYLKKQDKSKMNYVN